MRLNIKTLNGKKIFCFLLPALLLILPDQYSKYLAVQHLRTGGQMPILENILYFLYVENRGAAFGMLHGQQWFFYLITTVVFFAILYMIGILPEERRYRPLFWTAVLIFGGAAGNFIDRLRHAYVVDFIYFSPIDFPVFNVADIFVTCGCILMLYLFLFYYKDEDFLFLKQGREAEGEKAWSGSPDGGKDADGEALCSSE